MSATASNVPVAPVNHELYTVHDDGRLTLNFHPGQLRAWDSTARFVAVLAGTQSGKTSWGPWWLWREIYDKPVGRGAGDYLAVTSSYDLFKLKMLPALRETFEHVLQLGRYWSGDRILELADPETGKFLAKRSDDRMWGRIILRSAESGGGLESTTAKGAWLDEAGQDAFAIDSFEAVLRRLSLALGRVLITTTLYNFGWLKTEVYDRWVKGDPEYEIVHFDSTENPLFSPEEFERARATMPLWRFNMQYRGRYEKPAGLIYDSFNDKCVWKPFAIPADWNRYLGLDFGGVNTAGVFFAAEPNSPRLYLYREYLAGGKTAKGHVNDLLDGESSRPAFAVGGAPSEDQWRDEFSAAGLAVQRPTIKDVEVGISRVYGRHARNEIIVFSTCDKYLAQKRAYSRKLDRSGQPTEAIEAKATYHLLDAERYIVGYLEDDDDGPLAF